MASAAVLLCFLCQADASQDKRETVVVPAEERRSRAPGYVIVIPREELQKHVSAGNDWGKILAKLLPSMTTSNESLSNAGQTLRGGFLTILIDGIPQSSPLRNAQRDLRLIDPSVVERVEVHTLPTAPHLYGATVTVINFITTKPAKEACRFSMDWGLGVSGTHPEESVRGRAAQVVRGTVGSVGYVIGASVETCDRFFDADGQTLSPSPHGQGGLPETDTTNLLTKIALALDRQTLTLMANQYSSFQNTELITLNGVPGRAKTRAVQGVVPGENAGTKNQVITARYEHDDAWGSRAEVELFYQEYSTRFAFSPFFPAGGGQSFVESEKWGGRFFVDTPIPALLDARVGWGFDYINDRTAQPLEDGRIYAPRMFESRVGLFVQAEILIERRLAIRGGVRQDYQVVEVKDFRTLFGGLAVRGDHLTFQPTLPNAGVEFRVSESTTLFAGFARTFSIADIGLDLQTTAQPSVDAFNPQGQYVDNYELGLRVTGDVGGSVIFFYNASEDGITFGNPPAFLIRRLPERVYGVEGTLVARVSPQWTVELSCAWMEGEQDRNRNGDHEAFLPSYRIPPFKATLALEHQTLPGWINRIQVLYSAERDRFGGGSANFGEGFVEDFAVVTLTSSIAVGGGWLRLALENAFNEDYYSVVSQSSNVGRLYTAAEGAVVRISFTKEW